MLRIASVLLTLLGPATSAWAWGSEGHSIVGEIAQRRLTKAAETGVIELIGPGASLASVGSWADDERTRDAATSRWHFVDIPYAASTYDHARDCELIAGAGDCLIAEIDRERAIVACAAAPADKRRRALKFLVHFVGDLHQPFHTLLEKRGGNQVDVTVVTREGVNGKVPFNTNLHAAWDAALIEKTAWSWGSYVERLQADFLGSADSIALTQGTTIQWAEESHALAVRLFDAVPANGVLDDVYRARILPDLDRQLSHRRLAPRPSPQRRLLCGRVPMMLRRQA